MLKFAALAFLLFHVSLSGVRAQTRPPEMQEVKAGQHTPFLSDGDGDNRPIVIEEFLMDEHPVTNSAFNKFVLENPKWKKSQAISLFVDENYLSHWRGGELSEEKNKTIGNAPVTNVSWFAAKAYCEAQGKRLATVNEWEYASDADNPENIKTILHWYGAVSNKGLSSVSQMAKGKNGLKGMHGHIWEWVDDYNSVLITQDSRNSPTDKLEGLFCGGGSLKSKDASNYASFMRHAFRSGLSGKYTNSLLGFRCAKSKVQDSEEKKEKK